MKVEYKVREIKRYIVTRFESTENTGSSSVRGEYDNFDMAYNVACALAKMDRDNLGYPPGDDRIMFPEEKPSENVAEQN